MSVSIERLRQQDAEYEFELLPGIKVTVWPLTTLSKEIAEASARRLRDEVEESHDVCVLAGIMDPSAVDFSNPDILEGLYQRFFIRELAVGHIVRWEGVVDDKTEEPLQPTSDNVRALMDIHPFGDLFRTRLLRHYVKVLAAKKDCGVTAPGTSGKTEAPITARTAKSQIHPVAGENAD